MDCESNPTVHVSPILAQAVLATDSPLDPSTELHFRCKTRCGLDMMQGPG